MTNFGALMTALLLVVAGATHWIVYRWALYAFPGLARHRKILIAAAAVVIAAQPITRLVMNRLHDDVSATLHVVSFFEIMSVAIAAIPIGAMRIIGWLATRRTRAATPDAGAAPRSPDVAPVAPVTRRQAIERIGGIGFLAGTGSLLGWGIVRGRHAFEIDEVVVKIAGLPRALDGYTLAQISDLHAGIFLGEGGLEEGLSRVAEVRPDLLVVTGDIVDFDPTYARLVARKLADAAPRDGVAAILGNHDYYAGAPIIVEAMRAAGIELLMNSARHVRAQDGGGFALLGVDDLWAPRAGGGGPDLERAMAMVSPDLARVLLSHQPRSVDLWPGKIALQLSGHTHGGQINPGFRPAAFIMRYLSGRFEVGGTTLYVNRGFGTAGPPVRVGAPPEVTKVVLVSA